MEQPTPPHTIETPTEIPVEAASIGEIGLPMEVVKSPTDVPAEHVQLPVGASSEESAPMEKTEVSSESPLEETEVSPESPVETVPMEKVLKDPPTAPTAEDSNQAPFVSETKAELPPVSNRQKTRGTGKNPIVCLYSLSPCSLLLSLAFWERGKGCWFFIADVVSFLFD